MVKPLVIKLSESEREELEKSRDSHPKSYIRERCAALLKIASGESGLQVAVHGLYKARSVDTIYAWVHRYEEKGFSGLFMEKGRGRKASFSPKL